MKKVLGNVACVILVVGGVLGVKFFNMNQASAEAKTHAAKALESIPGYAQERDYYESLLDAHHDAAFKSAYDMGSRRRSASFDHSGYLKELHSLMLDQAQGERRSVAHSLERHRQQFLSAGAAQE